jgi:thymidylate synthase (FAD)
MIEDIAFQESGYQFSRELGLHDNDILLRDVAFNKHRFNDGHHLSPYDQGMVDVGFDNIEVRLVQGIDEDNFKRTLSKAQRATIGIPANDDGDIGDWEEMMKGGLQTALESQTIIFEVIGLSRATTHQLVRSRRAAFHQQSMRASYMGDHPNARMPESIWQNKNARDAYMVAIEAAHNAYRIACDEEVSYQDARYILPIGTETYIMCEYPVREFLAVYAYRACSMFQWEICHIVREMGRLLGDAHPWIKPYIKISCESVKKCTFQGWEDVEQGCDLPWANWEDRVYKPQAHRIRTNS